jgi:hypothetical protein
MPRGVGPHMKHSEWTGRTRVVAYGSKNTKYVLVKCRYHPFALDGGWVPEHRLVVERALGRFVHPRHPIHHINGDGLDNRSCNLVLCEDIEYHTVLHRRQRALEACGNPSARCCTYCQKYSDPVDMVPRIVRGKSTNYFHRKCVNEYQRLYNAKNPEKHRERSARWRSKQK